MLSIFALQKKTKILKQMKARKKKRKQLPDNADSDVPVDKKKKKNGNRTADAKEAIVEKSKKIAAKKSNVDKKNT